MSFVKKAFKAVFKVVKKVGKFVKRAWNNKWVRTALLVGATFFTAGVAAGGGWANFWSAATKGGVGNFFSTVGSTIAEGFSTITGSLFKGGGEVVTKEVATNTATGFVEGDAIARTAVEAVGETIVKKGAEEAVNKTLVERFWGSLMSDTPSGSMLRNFVVGGIINKSNQKRYDEELERRNNATIFGGPAFGGTTEDTIRNPVFNLETRTDSDQIMADPVDQGQGFISPLRFQTDQDTETIEERKRREMTSNFAAPQFLGVP